MNILIDTQVLVWLVNGDSRLGKQARQTLLDTANKVAISYFSLFELAIKASIGKITGDSSVAKDLSKMGIDLVMPDVDILETYTIISPDNRDPFDNVIMAVARNEKYVFVTSDSKVLATVASDLTIIDATK